MGYHVFKSGQKYDVLSEWSTKDVDIVLIGLRRTLQKVKTDEGKS